MNSPLTNDQKLTAASVLGKLSERFTSGNSVPVERTHITRAEFRALLDDVSEAGDLGFHRGHQGDCHSCRVSIAIHEALTALERTP